MIKTVEQLKEQAKAKNITHYKVHSCSMCGYPCGYLINGDKVAYDSGCDCVTNGPNIKLRSWEDLTETYNRNQPENNPDIKQPFLDELNRTWKF